MGQKHSPKPQIWPMGFGGAVLAHHSPPLHHLLLHFSSFLMQVGGVVELEADFIWHPEILDYISLRSSVFCVWPFLLSCHDASLALPASLIYPLSAVLLTADKTAQD